MSIHGDLFRGSLASRWTKCPMRSRQYQPLPSPGHGPSQTIDPPAQVVEIGLDYFPTPFPNEIALPMYPIPLCTPYLRFGLSDTCSLVCTRPSPHAKRIFDCTILLPKPDDDAQRCGERHTRGSAYSGITDHDLQTGRSIPVPASLGWDGETDICLRGPGGCLRGNFTTPKAEGICHPSIQGGSINPQSVRLSSRRCSDR